MDRDIKPDNLIVAGAVAKDDAIWDNPGSDAEPSSAKKEPAGTGGADAAVWDQSLRDFDAADREPDWGALLKKWKVTLIDFGFARALTPNDVHQPSLEMRRENLSASFHPKVSQGAAADDKKSSGRSAVDNSTGSSGRISRGRRSFFRSRSSSMGDDSSNKSFSHLLGRRMSALGNRNFAAPEIVDHVQRNSGRSGEASSATSTSATTEPIQVTQTISDFVADYGLMVDSYSMGFTLKYMMSGVPPYRSIEEAIAEKDSCCNKICGGPSRNAKRQPNYRRLGELPGEARRLIQKLTERAERERTSIRKARRSYLWISDVFSGSPEYERSVEQQHELSEISYLPLAMKSVKTEEDKKIDAKTMATKASDQSSE